MNKTIQLKKNRIVSVIVVIAMILTLTPAAFMMQTDVASAEDQIASPKITSTATTWDCVYFGNYYQSESDRTYKSEPIKWRVLSVNGNEALLLSDKIIDSGIPYNTEYENVTWENCTIRSWLNGYDATYNQGQDDFSTSNFMNKAFTPEEKDSIVSKTVKNSYHPLGGNDTEDKVFLLSVDEITNPDYGFVSSYEYSKLREAVNTAYAASAGNMYGEGQRDWWWLRTPGYLNKTAALVEYTGAVRDDGFDVDDEENCGIRPAIWIDLGKASWTPAEAISCDRRCPMEMAVVKIPDVKYTGKTANPSITVKLYGRELVKGHDYTISTSSVNVGKGTVKITGKGLYIGSLTKSFKINPAGTTIKAPKAAKKAFTAKWTKQAAKMSKSRITGYQVQYSKSSDFTTACKTKSVAGYSKTSKAITKLAAKTKYYVRVRTYKNVDGKNYYSTWSKVKSVKTK